MVREFKFFRGYKQNTLTEQWEDIFRGYPITTPDTGIINWGTTTTNPAWRVNLGLVQYAPPTHTVITTTPGTGTYTIPFSGTATGLSLITSNPNGITYTTTGMVGAFTTTGTISTNTFYTSNIK